MHKGDLNHTLVLLSGELLEASQLEASRLRQKVESLAKDNEILRSTSSLDKLTERAGIKELTS